MQKKLLAVLLGYGAFYADSPSVAAVATPEGGAALATPAAAPVKAPPPPAPFPNTTMQEIKFHFKKDELGNKRATVQLYGPMPTWEGIVAACGDATKIKDKEGKETDKTVGSLMQALITDLVGGTVVGQMREQVGDEKNPVNKQEELDVSKLSLAYIASIPPSERRGGGIGKETWAEFFKDYLAVMPEKTNKKPEQVENAAKLFLARLQPVKTQKKILAFLQSQLNLWYTSTTDDSREEFAEVKEFLDGKIEEFMKRDEAELLANL